jgi:Flp pilus assembly protein TadG
VLVLMPAAVLVFLVLGALAVDAAAVFLAQRHLANAASAAANDAASQAVDLERFYADGSVRLLALDAQRVAAATVERLRFDHLSDVRPVATVRGDVVEVTVSARARQVFAPAIPGGPDTVAVAATAVAQGRGD